MKKFLIATALVALASVAHAGDVVLVNGDGSELSALCIAAVKSDLTGISPLKRKDVLCNGIKLERFALQMRQQIGGLQKTSYFFSMNDESKMTRLCMAAVQSEEAYLATRKELFGSTLGVEDTILCNNMPIKAFARKYRNRAETAGL